MRNTPLAPVFSCMIVAALMMSAGAASAHHSVAMFDGKRTVKVSGTVTAIRWINPHAVFEFDGSGDSGASGAHYIVEMQAPNTMTDAGWSRETLAVGDHITVMANPLREPPAAGEAVRLLYVGIILAEGRAHGRIGEL